MVVESTAVRQFKKTESADLNYTQQCVFFLKQRAELKIHRGVYFIKHSELFLINRELFNFLQRDINFFLIETEVLSVHCDSSSHNCKSLSREEEIVTSFFTE